MCSTNASFSANAPQPSHHENLPQSDDYPECGIIPIISDEGTHQNRRGSLCSMPSPRHTQVALKAKVKQKIRTVFSPFHKKRSGISSPTESLSPQSQFSPQELGSLPVELPTGREMHELYGGEQFCSRPKYDSGAPASVQPQTTPSVAAEAQTTRGDEEEEHPPGLNLSADDVCQRNLGPDGLRDKKPSVVTTAEVKYAIHVTMARKTGHAQPGDAAATTARVVRTSLPVVKKLAKHVLLALMAAKFAMSLARSVQTESIRHRPNFLSIWQSAVLTLIGSVLNKAWSCSTGANIPRQSTRHTSSTRATNKVYFTDGGRCSFAEVESIFDVLVTKGRSCGEYCDLSGPLKTILDPHPSASQCSR